MQWKVVALPALMVSLFILGCGSSLSSSSSSSTTRVLDANTSLTGTTATTYAFNTKERDCEMLSRDTSPCQSSREALGLSGNWLDFSCNVVEGLADSSKNATTDYSNAVYVTLTTEDMPDRASNYFPTSGSYSFSAYGETVAGLFDDLYQSFTPPFPDPNTISAKDITMYIPITPTAAASKSEQMGGGGIGVAIDGILIYSSIAADTDNIFAEDGSFDQCGGHADGSEDYHYHSEPYSISFEDNNLIGVMMDGYFVYGRYDSPAKTNEPGSIANVGTDTTGTMYIYGGETGTTDPVTGATTASTFRYFLSEWKACYHESHGTKSSNDGETDDSNNSATGDCTGGEWVDGWMLTGHGNGGVFMKGGTGTGGAGNGVSGWADQDPSQSTNGIRYYYGVPGSCSGCH